MKCCNIEKPWNKNLKNVSKKTILKEWKTSTTITIFKKRVKIDPDTYTADTLLNMSLKAYTEVLDLNSCIAINKEQQRFMKRKNRHTIDAIYIIRQIIKNLSIRLALVRSGKLYTIPKTRIKTGSEISKSVYIAQQFNNEWNNR